MLARLDDPRKPLPPARIYELVKEALAACATSIEAEQPRAAKQLKKASTHWLRHTLGRVWADRGGDLRVLGEILGHSNPATTAIYSRADEKRRRQEFNKVFG
jgi:site-specific recombinase XerD